MSDIPATSAAAETSDGPELSDRPETSPVTDATDAPELPRTVADEGAESFFHGLPRENCPYPPGADERAEWLAGWDKAAASPA
jgi:ribosome modulation factor